MMWQTPPRSKVYEALTCLGDGRIEVTPTGCRVRSSDRDKTYTVRFSRPENAIMSNDNASYWRGYLGYPALVCLMEYGVIHYSQRAAVALAGIPWKRINDRLKHDHARAEAYALEHAAERGVSRDELKAEVDRIAAQLSCLNLKKLGKPEKPAVPSRTPDWSR